MREGVGIVDSPVRFYFHIPSPIRFSPRSATVPFWVTYCVPFVDGFLLCFVRNMGNFNFSLIRVLTFLHHIEQCCYPSFLILPHIPAMTSHVAYVIYAIFTLITTQGLCNITLSPYVFLSLMQLGPYFFMFITFFLASYPCRLTHSV